MKYAKLIDGYPVFAPNRVVLDDVQIYNAPAEILINLGYFPVYETEMPDCPEGYYCVPEWTQESDRIVQGWSIIEMDADPTDYENVLTEIGVIDNEEN